MQSETQEGVVRLVNMLINNGYKTIIIAGGDSALNDAVNCLMATDKTTRDNIALGLIPNGTMNDFARYWDMKEKDIDNNIKQLKNRRIKKIDVGCITTTNDNEPQYTRHFINSINIGLLSAIMNMKQKTRRLLGSRTMSFIISIALMLFQRLDYKMIIKINSDIIKRKIMTLCIGNARGYGQTPNAVPYNGMLDVSIVYQPQLTQLFEGFYLLITGKFLNHHNVHPYRTQEITIIEAPKAMVSIDGRIIKTPNNKYKIYVKPEAINFIIPS